VKALRQDKANTQELLLKFLLFMAPAIMEGIKCDIETSMRVATNIVTIPADEKTIMDRVLQEARGSIVEWLVQLSNRP
jgi:hypothetical protein